MATKGRSRPAHQPSAAAEPRGTMSALGVKALAAALRVRGVDVAAALAEAGVDPAALADAEGRVDLQQAFCFFERAPALSGDPHFGVHAALLVPAGALEALEYVARSCATLGDALVQIARFYAVVDDRAALRVERDGDRFAVHYTSPPRLKAPRPAIEFLFAYVVGRAREYAGQAIALREVCFRAAAPDAPAPVQAYFGAPVRYGASTDSFELARGVAALPMRAPDAGLSSVLERVLEQSVQALGPLDMLTDVKACIARRLRRGAPSLEEIAAELRTSRRTLQRRLQEDGARFSDLVTDVQRELSAAYLRNRDLSVGEIAYLVGFEDRTSFHRAYRRWTGETPSEARRGPSEP